MTSASASVVANVHQVDGSSDSPSGAGMSLREHPDRTRASEKKATQIVREVREERAEYVVTVNGEPAAVLVPYVAPSTSEPPSEVRKEEIRAWLREGAEIAKELGKTWPPGLSAADAVAEQRR